MNPTAYALPSNVLGADLGVAVIFDDEADATPANVRWVAKWYRDQWGIYYLDYRPYYDALMNFISTWPEGVYGALSPYYPFDALKWYIGQHSVDIPPAGYSITEQEREQLHAAVIEHHGILCRMGEAEPCSFEVKTPAPRPTVPATKTALPAYLTAPVCKLVGELSRDFINQGQQAISVGGGSANAVILASLSADDNVTLPARFTPYDRAVFSAVCSELESGNTTIWPSRIFRVMSGKADARVDEHMAKRVGESLRRMMMAWVKIDYSQQAQLYGHEDVDSYIIEGNMLYAEAVVIRCGGQEIEGYRIVHTPPVLEYARRMKQIISVPLKRLDTGSAVRNSAENIMLKHYLIQRIEKARNPKNYMRGRVLYDTIFKECQLETTHKTQRSRYRATVRKLLDYWTSDGYILGYSSDVEGVDIQVA